jgi:hypothetical protein
MGPLFVVAAEVTVSGSRVGRGGMQQMRLATVRSRYSVDMLTVSAAAERLNVSEDVISGWLEAGVLAYSPGSVPPEIDRQTFEHVQRTLTVLREQGQNPEWLQQLVDFVDDRTALDDEAVRQGIEDLRAGNVEPEPGGR